MVNAKATTRADTGGGERRERARAPEPVPAALGLANANPFGDLHALQHLTARLARALRPALAPLLPGELRVFAEPVAVVRLGDQRAARGDAPAVRIALVTEAATPAQLVVAHGFVLELLDLFFGGPGGAPAALPRQLSPAAAALAARLAAIVAPALTAAWEPVAPLAFIPDAAELDAPGSTIGDDDDPVVATRIGVARGTGAPAFLDILYPVALLKPHAGEIVRKVHGRAPAVPPAWRQDLTRAVMDVALPVRTVLAEPVLPLARLLSLQVGDVIPIGVGDKVPVMVGRDRLGWGTVGTSAGRAAIRLDTLALEGPRP